MFFSYLVIFIYIFKLLDALQTLHISLTDMLFSRREGVKPSLELETKNGAILAEEDLVGMLFPTGSVQAEELKATITKKSLPPLIDRYEEACHQANTSMLFKSCTNKKITLSF